MKVKISLVCLFLFLLVVPMVYSITLDELIASYDFTYSSDPMNVTSVAHYGNDTNSNLLYDDLIVNITMGNDEGNYTFIGDLYRNNNLITTISDTYYLYDGKNTIPLYYNAKLLENSIYNLSLTIQENYLTVYREDNIYSFDFDNSLYEKPDISIEINSYELINNDVDGKYEILRINTAINSSINGIFEINALMGNSKTINTKNNYSLINGVNVVDIDFDGKEIRRERINNSRLYLITIENGVNYGFDFDYSLNYNLYDFDAEQSVLGDSYSEGGVDLDANNLSDFLEINISLDINESGLYSIELELDDLYNDYVKKATKEFSLNEGEQTIGFRINGTDIYNSKVNGPYLLEYVRLSKENITLDSVSKPYITNSYNYDEFERPLMPDLVIKGLEINENNVKINLANEGDNYAFAFNVEIFDDNFNSVKESLIDYLAPGNSENISYNINTSNTSKLYAIVDYDNNIEESNETNNLFTKELEASIKFNISLNKGWNLISFPLNLTNKTLPKPLESIEGNYSKLFTYSNKKWIELKDNDKINETMGFWINMKNNNTLEIKGHELDNLKFDLNKGWNLISYPSLNKSLINETLKDINYSIVYYYNSKWYSYTPIRNDSLNKLKYFIPGYGYWVNVKNDTILALN